MNSLNSIPGEGPYIWSIVKAKKEISMGKIENLPFQCTVT